MNNPDPKVSDTFRALPPLPPGSPKRLRISVMLIQFLLFHSRLDGLMSFVAVWWGGWTLALSEFWVDWPVTRQITALTWGYPNAISWALLLAGVLGYISKHRKWHRLRSICFLTEFASWGVLSLVFFTIHPPFSPGVACYSAFALATLLAYVNFRMDLEHRASRMREGDINVL